MNTIISNNKPVKALEKLTVIQEAKQIGVLAALHYFASFYPAAEEELIKWFNELHRMGIAVIAGSVKIQMLTILSTTCADKYLGASQQFCVPKSWFYQFLKQHQLSFRHSFEGHLTDMVKHKYAVNNIHKAIIPGGLTLIIQPLDLTKKGNLKRPSYSLICQWILKAWDDISAEMIIKSFKKCGISNELDETEDDLLYDSDKENSEIDNNEDLTEIVEEDSLFANELEE
ncbi:23546_t:CDS:2 [Dentiscutata erythropus]|uniref:23546_t:CDS:1 n=1 Tax=Dentiscutata erythropus TaxID=1348616 RepID=A0A9N9ITK9_9GLOM|nr:23546_t:CDS:2 [Dentiscutata erythropus]